jgi:hypothetical protein
LRWVITNGILDSLKGMEGKQTHPEIEASCTHNSTGTSCTPV